LHARRRATSSHRSRLREPEVAICTTRIEERAKTRGEERIAVVSLVDRTIIVVAVAGGIARA